MESLPNEILSMIFEYLNDKEALSIFWTCKRFAEVMSITRIKLAKQYYYPWNKPLVIGTNTNFFYRHNYWIVTNLPNNKFILNLMKQNLLCRYLSISIDHLREFNENDIINNIDHLWIYLHNSKQFPPILGKIKRLDVMNNCEFDSIDSLENTEILYLGNTSIYNIYNSPNLRTLIINQRGQVRNIKNLTSLKILKIATFNYKNHKIKNIEFPDNLRKLKLSYILDTELSPNIPLNIEKLSLYECHHLKNIDHLLNLKRLQKIKLTNCDSIEEILAFRNITNLTISTSHRLLFNIRDLQIFKNLRKLTLYKTQQIANLVISPNFKVVKIYECDIISGISKIENLDKLKIKMCDKLNYITCIKNIKKLIISHCEKIATLSYITNIDYLKLKGLNRLKLIRHCNAIDSLHIDKNLDTTRINALYDTQHIYLDPINIDFLKILKSLLNNNLKYLTTINGNKELTDAINKLKIEYNFNFSVNNISVNNFSKKNKL